MQLVNLRETDLNLIFDIRYATADNFTGKPVYQQPGCYLHDEAAEKMARAVELATPHGLTFKIFDAYRPIEVQRALWEHTPDPNFLSNPDSGACPHCRGVAIDLTLVDKSGNELDMGTGFDDFRTESHHGTASINVEAQQNRFLLLGLMSAAGWDFYKNEWWHYQLFNPRKYDILADSEMQTGMVQRIGA